MRYDQYREHLPNGRYLDNREAGKGLELIPTTTNEVIFNLTACEKRGGAGSKRVARWSDCPFLPIKQRLFSGNEQGGDAIVTAFLSASAPTGSAAFARDAWVLTPRVAGGEGSATSTSRARSAWRRRSAASAAPACSSRATSRRSAIC